MRNRMLLVATGALVAAASSASAVNLLTNPSFETDNASASPFFIRYSPPPTGPAGWTTILDGVDLVHNNYTQGPAVLVDAHDGVQFLDMNALGLIGGIRQDVAVSAGQSYSLSGWVSAWATNSAGSLRFSVTDLGTNAVLGSADFPSVAGVWNQHGITVTPTTGSVRVQIEVAPSSGTFQAGPGLDDLSFALVPEPASLGLVAIAGMVLRRKRLLR